MGWRSRRFRSWLKGIAVLLGGAAVLLFVYWLARLPSDALSAADQRASVVGAAAGVIALVLTVLLRRLPRTSDPAVELDSAAEWLARRLRVAYERETDHRQLQRLGPLEVKWEPVRGGVVSQASQRIPGTGGDLSSLVAAFAHLDPKQLVITGHPMSGKSSMALLMALALLKNKETDQVPVVLSVTSWLPGQQSLSEWLISRLREEYPELNKQVPRGLIEQRRVLPVLDGFDELPEELHDAARERLVEATASGRPFILTARTEAYLQAVRAQGKAFGQAAVVRLRPVTAAQAIAALRADDIEEIRQRWQPVEQRITNSSNSPLARVLSSPLMVYLARLAYSPRDTDPAQLTRFKRDKDIIRHLYDSYIPALYRDHDDPLRVRRWLSFLAHRLEKSEHSTNLAWWRLFLLVPRTKAVLILTIGTTANYLFFRQYGLYGVIIGFVLVGLCISLTNGRPPRQLRLRQIGPKNFVAATAIGVAAGCAFIPIVGPRHNTWFAVLAVSTVGVTVTALVSVAFSLRSPDKISTVEPRAMLANDRTVLLGIIALVGLAAGIRSGVQYSVERGLIDGLQMVILIGLLLSAGMRLGAGWLTFGIARLALCLRRGFPWRLLGFLEDAHRRGVLRRSGPFYQFRHADLQRYLANHPDGTT